MKSPNAITKRLPRLVAIMVSIGITGLSTQVVAAITAKQDSSDFSYKYEMESEPSVQDLDTNGTNDFKKASYIGTGSVANGLLTMSSLKGRAIYYISDPAATGTVWQVMAPTRQSGFTIEIRLRVKSQDDPDKGAIIISATASDSNADGSLRIGNDFVKWGESTLTTLQSEVSNTNGFHVFRFAMAGGQPAGSEKFSVWRDGVLLADDLADTLPTYNGLNRLYFGDISTGTTGGDVEISYFRFTSGAYAPTTTLAYPRMASSEFPKKFEMNNAAGEVDPAGNTAEWTRSVSGVWSATLLNGLLEIDTSSSASATAYWNSVPWPDVTALNLGYTLEIKVRVDASVASSPSDAVLSAYLGNGRASGFLIIGVSNTYWGSASNIIDNRDNSDKLHVFRLAYEGEGINGFKVWRDGELIGSMLPRYNVHNLFYFGAPGSSYGGKGVYDYVRWTMGCFEPDPILKGTLIKVQ